MSLKDSKVSQLSGALIRAIKSPERILPKKRIEDYIRKILEMRGDFLESASSFGTPQYFFDEPALTREIARFKAAFEKHIDRYRLYYAMKSNPFKGICDHMVSSGMGLDVSSGMELSIALASGCSDIIFSGPGKTDEELDLALRNRRNVTLLMDSFGEFERLEKLLNRHNVEDKSLKLGIRVCSKNQGIWKKFGIQLKDLSKFFEKAASSKKVDLCGIQFHTSWNLSPSAQIGMIKELGSHIRKNMPEIFRQSLRFLDIGGGFWPENGEWLNPQNTMKGKLRELLKPDFRFGSSHYFFEAKPLDLFIREIAKALSQSGAPLNKLEIWAEPGRWLSTHAMHILLRVIDKKDESVLITDGGTNMLGWERPLSEYIPLINLTRPALKERALYVFGSLCTPMDIWGRHVFSGEIHRGDILILPDQGAYTYSLRQSFIKPKSKVVCFDGRNFKAVDPVSEQ